MRVLVTGAYGLIGTRVVQVLRADGIEVVGAVRDPGLGRRLIPGIEWIGCDFNTDVRVEDWLPRLKGIDAVVNCAGLLQDAPGQSLHAVHVDGAQALFSACERAGVGRVVHISAVGVDQQRPTKFLRTKLQGDEALMATGLEWVILRPSVVVGRAAYGGSALFRALAALPGIIPLMAGAGELQIVHVGDVAATVRFFLRSEAPARRIVELVGPQRLTLSQVVQHYRRWLGLPPARMVEFPPWMVRLIFRLGDFAGWLGWRPPIRTTAARELMLGAVGDPAPWTKLTGIKPRALGDALAAESASVQEKWFARLYLLKPVALVVLSLFWLGTGLISLGPGYGIGEDVMREGGVEGLPAMLAIVGGGLLDVLIGIGIALRRTARMALRVSAVTCVAYAVIGTILVPRLWIDPLGPMLKIWPILAFTIMTLAILDDR